MQIFVETLTGKAQSESRERTRVRMNNGNPVALSREFSTDYALS